MVYVAPVDQNTALYGATNTGYVLVNCGVATPLFGGPDVGDCMSPPTNIELEVEVEVDGDELDLEVGEVETAEAELSREGLEIEVEAEIERNPSPGAAYEEPEFDDAATDETVDELESDVEDIGAGED